MAALLTCFAMFPHCRHKCPVYYYCSMMDGRMANPSTPRFDAVKEDVRALFRKRWDELSIRVQGLGFGAWAVGPIG